MSLPPVAVPADPTWEEIDAFADRWRLEERAAAIDRASEFPRPEFRAMGIAGLLGLHTSLRRGGRGLPLRRTGSALFHLAYRGGTAFAKLSLQPEFCSVLAEHGGDALVGEFFRPLVRGERLIGNQITEPSAGSDAAAVELEARPTQGGYVLKGVKSEAAFAEVADAAIVYGRVRGSDAPGLTAFLVPQANPRIQRHSVPDLGERWMGRGSIEYDSVRVPRRLRIGEEGRALEYVRGELTRERALLAAVYLGVARASWEETVAYVGLRRAFGTTLDRQQAVAFPLVEDGASIDATWLYVERCLRSLEDGEDAASNAALAKWMATEVALRTLDHAIQFHGGRGYSGALPHERRWRDVRSGAIAHGTSEVMHLVAARRMWPGERSSKSESPRSRPRRPRRT